MSNTDNTRSPLMSPKTRAKLKKGIKTLVAGVLMTSLAVGGVFAYLRSADTRSSTFKLAEKIDIEVVEPHWVEDSAKGMLPSQEIAKDPALHNLSAVKIYAFADVKIPTKDIVTANADGTLNPSAVTELFTYELNDGWTLKDTITEEGSVTYRYAYDSLLDGDGTTGSIFDAVKVCNYVDDQLDTLSAAQKIVVIGHAIQSQGLSDVDKAYEKYFGSLPDEPTPPVEDTKIAVSRLVVNDASILQDNTYEIYQVEPQMLTATAVASADTQVTFTDLALEKTAAFAVIPEGGNIETDAIANITADEAFASQAADAATSDESVVIGVPVVIAKSAYAVYSDTDKSLDFYKRAEVPTVGAMFKGKAVTAVYTGIETDVYSNAKAQPWNAYADSIKKVAIIDNGIRPISIQFWFLNLKSCTTIDVSKLDTSSTTNMKSTFCNCSSLTAINGISEWNTSNVTDMTGVFSGCSKLSKLDDLSSWDTSNVIKFYSTFQNCSSLTAINGISKWDTSSLTDTYQMFYGCTSLSKLEDLSGWDMSNVTATSRMFYGCSSLTAINGISEWDTSNVTTMFEMFYKCINLTTVGDLSGWDMSNVIYMQETFSGCYKLTVDCSKWNVPKVTKYENFNLSASKVIPPTWVNAA